MIFNDYMNTLMGDPTTARLRPLAEAAAAVGAEYFCVDAGWYAEAGQPWWDTVGEWQPAASRFPGGISEVLDHIRGLGMVPGLWLEPEVVGVRSPVADRLGDSAFFCRDGGRVAEHGRYHLAWLDSVLDRHPGLVLENCASGGMRMDHALLARLQVQSTSDQQDFLRYAAIAAAAPAAVPRSRARSGPTQPEFTDAEIAFTLCSALLGRIHLSGHLDRMSPAQRALVAGAIAVYREIRPDLGRAVPLWPLGRPGWDDPWLALALRSPAQPGPAPDVTYLLTWRRPPGGAGAAVVPLPHLRGGRVRAEILYPPGDPGRISWDPAEDAVTVRLPEALAACLVRLRKTG